MESIAENCLSETSDKMELSETDSCKYVDSDDVNILENIKELENSRYLSSMIERINLNSSDLKFNFLHPPKNATNLKNITGLKSMIHAAESPSSIGHLTFLLDCFVISFGPDMPQLGRYHPQSDPENFVMKEEDQWSLTSEDESAHSTLHWTNFFTERHNAASIFNLDAVSDISEDLIDNRQHTFYPPGFDASNYSERNYIDFDAVSEFAFPDDLIIRELSEMRIILERLLENRDLLEWNNHNGLRDILAMLPEGHFSHKEPSPHYPVGEWEFHGCGICLESQWLFRRPCCGYCACSDCLQMYYSNKVEEGIVQIECVNYGCHSFVHRDEISARLDVSMKERFHTLLILANQDATRKTCPRCNHVTKYDKKKKNKKSERLNGDDKRTCVLCEACGLEWCFPCHAPWHGPLTCKQFRKGDRLLRSWAKEKSHGQLNAQKCPKCKIYIQRTTGCDHMHCARCKTDFCYKCGDRFRYLKFFGDHYSKLSVFGCKYRFKADRPVQRKVIRGAIFGGKIVAAPVLGALALCAGALAVGVGFVALPVYGGVRLYRHCEGKQRAKALRRQPFNAGYTCDVWEEFLEQ